MASKTYPFMNYQDSIHYWNNCSATIVIVKFLLSLSTNSYNMDTSDLHDNTTEARGCIHISRKP